MIDMSNIFFCPFSSLFRKSPKCQQQKNVYILNELHSTDKLKKIVTFMFLFLDLLFVYMYICIS